MMQRKNILASAMLAGLILLPGVSHAAGHGIKLGFIGGFTGPIESLTPAILAGAEAAVADVNAAGGVNGDQITMLSGDTTCVDATAATNAADRLVNSEKVSGIVGALCSGSTIAAANNVAIPGGVVMISPASTSPAISAMEDNGLVYRTVPSDAFQGQQLAKLLMDNGIDNIAITYINNDYGKGFADALSDAYTGMGGTVSASEAHEDGKADYRAEIGSLASGGAEHLVVLAYADGSGQTIIRQAIEGGDFANFVGGDGMNSASLIEAVGAEELEGMILTSPGAVEGMGKEAFAAKEIGGVYADSAYDAAFLLALALAKAGGDMAGVSAALNDVANPPGEMIYPGEWEKAASIIAEGGDVNYEGAAGSHDFDANGDVDGVIEKFVITNGEIVNEGVIM